MSDPMHSVVRQMRGCLLPVLAVLAGLTATPGHTQVKVPPHECPWVESTRLDPQTLFFWKFSVGDDPAVDADENKDDPVDRTAQEPELHGGAKVTAHIGRFGGGLLLDGAGYAAANAALGPVLQAEKGFTLGGWIRSTAPTTRQTVLLLPDTAEKALLQLDWMPDARLAVLVNGTERLQVPLPRTAGGWHFFALTCEGGKDPPPSPYW